MRKKSPDEQELVARLQIAAKVTGLGLYAVTAAVDILAARNEGASSYWVDSVYRKLGPLGPEGTWETVELYRRVNSMDG